MAGQGAQRRTRGKRTGRPRPGRMRTGAAPRVLVGRPQLEMCGVGRAPESDRVTACACVRVRACASDNHVSVDSDVPIRSSCELMPSSAATVCRLASPMASVSVRAASTCICTPSRCASARTTGVTVVTPAANRCVGQWMRPPAACLRPSWRGKVMSHEINTHAMTTMVRFHGGWRA